MRKLITILLILAPLSMFNGEYSMVYAQEHLPSYYIERAEGFMQTGSWQELKHEVDEGLKHYPDEPDLRYFNGRYFYMARNLQDARYNLVRAIQNNDEHFKAKRLLVDVEDDLKHYSSAICYINELLEFQPYDRDLWRRKIGLYRKIGNNLEADAALERLAHIYPNDTVVRNELRNQRRESWNYVLKKSNLREAAEDLEQWIDLDPHNLSYYLELISILERMGEYERALGAANRGLHEFPNDSQLVHKALGIMTGLGLFTQALTFAKQHGGSGQLYAGLLHEVADDARLHDPYEVNGRLYELTHDAEALTYLINTSLTRGYEDDARYYLQEAIKRDGRTTPLLIKLYGLEKRFGNENASTRILEELFDSNPEDEELTEQYAELMLELASRDMAASQWDDADLHIAKALALLPTDHEAHPAAICRQITIMGHLSHYKEAHAIYQNAKAETNDPSLLSRYASAYEDVMGAHFKALIEEEHYEEALAEAQMLLRDIPNSEVAIRTCINMSQTLVKNDLFQDYAKQGYELFPEVPYFVIKYAIALKQQHREAEALGLVAPKQSADEWRHPQLTAAYSGIAAEWAEQLLKNHMPDIAMHVVDSALVHNPKDKELLYIKGIAYEHLKQFDKAYDLQRRYYNPSNAEQKEFYEHMCWLGYKGFKNRVDATYTGAFYDAHDETLSTIAHLYSIASIAYSRLLRRDVITGQISYKGIDGQRLTAITEDEKEEDVIGGIGLEFMGQWEHTFNARWSGMASMAYATQYFNIWSGNLSAAYNANHDWTLGLRFGYRRTPKGYIYLSDGSSISAKQDSNNLYLLSPSVEKIWTERIRTTANADMAIIRSGFYYNIGLKGKLFVNDDNITSVSLITSLGTFPELTFFEQTALQRLSHLNAMVGFDVQYLLTRHLCVGITGSWNTCYDPYRLNDGSTANRYRNIYSICVQLHLAF